MPYYVTRANTEEFARALYWDRLIGEGSPLPRLMKGEPLSSEDLSQLSTTLRIGEPLIKNEPVPDVMGTGPYVVSERTIDLIASLQKGAYKAIPIGLVEEKGGAIAAKYYALHLPVFLDCIDIEETKWLRGSGRQAALESCFIPKLGTPFALRAGSYQGHHIWRAAKPAELLYFISDELRNLFVDSSITGWEYSRCKTVT